MKKIFMVAIFVWLVTAGVLFAGAKAELWDRWVVFDDSSTEQIDHSAFQEFINEYRVLDPADNIAKVRYSLVSIPNKDKLDRYISTLENVNVDGLNADEQFAFWVNLYNAVTIQLILKEYPIESIRRIANPWDQNLMRISGENISLNDIEHRILRPRWKDPRIHFVVNCASIGCPDLPAQVLTAENSEAIMEESARVYLNHPRGVALRGRNLLVSSLLDWYKEDFGGGDEVLSYLSNYVDLAQITGRQDYSSINIRFDYDWSLNDFR